MEGKKFYGIARKVGRVTLFRQKGDDGMDGRWDKDGHLWSNKGHIKTHFKSIVNRLRWGRMLPLAEEATEIPDDTVIEYELREVRRYPLRSIYK